MRGDLCMQFLTNILCGKAPNLLLPDLTTRRLLTARRCKRTPVAVRPRPLLGRLSHAESIEAARCTDRGHPGTPSRGDPRPRTVLGGPLQVRQQPSLHFVLPQLTHARALDEAMVQMRSTAWIEHRRFELLRRDQLTSTSVESSMRRDKPSGSPERPSIERCVQSVLTEPLPRRGY